MKPLCQLALLVRGDDREWQKMADVKVISESRVRPCRSCPRQEGEDPEETHHLPHCLWDAVASGRSLYCVLEHDPQSLQREELLACQCPVAKLESVVDAVVQNA